MTVLELFNNFDFYPDEIVYFDEKENVQDTVFVAQITADGKKEYDGDRYNDFIDEYGDRELIDWHYRVDDVIDLEIGRC